MLVYYHEHRVVIDVSVMALLFFLMILEMRGRRYGAAGVSFALIIFIGIMLPAGSSPV